MTVAILTWLWPFGRSSQRFANDNPALTTDYPLIDSYPRASLTGISIDSNAAVTISAVWRAVQLIASTIASLPLRLYEEQGDGSSTQVQPVPYVALWGRPNPEVSRIVFWETAIGHEVLNGNCFIFVKGERPDIWLFNPERVEVARGDDGKKYYRVDGDPNAVYGDYANGGNIIHITGWGLDGLVGVSPIRAMANALGLMKAAETFSSLFFANGANPGGVLSTDAVLKPEQSAELKGRWDAAHQGLGASHGTAVLSSGLKWQSTAIDPEKGQMLETRQFQVAEVARMFGVPEHLIGSHDKTSSWGQGLEVNNRAFIQYGLMPHILRFEQTLSDEFLAAGFYVKWGIEGLLRGTSAERTAFYTAMFGLGALTTNQILRLEDMPEIGPEGDQHFVANNNLVPIDQVVAAMRTLGGGNGPESPPS